MFVVTKDASGAEVIMGYFRELSDIENYFTKKYENVDQKDIEILLQNITVKNIYQGSH